MNLQLYKPNAKNTGFAVNFSISQKGDKPTFFLNAIQQHSWNEANRTGNFSGNKDNDDKKIAIKLNEGELGEMLSTFTSRIPWNGFHDFGGNKTSISLTPWDKDRKVKVKDGEKVYKAPAFGLSIVQNGSKKFRFSLEAGEAELVKRFIFKYLDLYFASTTFKGGNDNGATSTPKNPTPAPLDDEDVPF